MSAFFIAFLVAAGFATWIWTQVNRRTGSADTKTSAITAGAAGLAAFVVVFTLLKYVLSIG